jgi:hypothetical protein
MRPFVRGASALLAVPALALSALVATSGPASAATDPAPATSAGYWLGAQLTGGIVHNQEYDFDDYGLTIDVGLAFHALESAGAPHSVVEGISDAIAANLDAYVAPGYGTNLSAGGVAKAMVLAQAAGDDPTSYGGHNLLTDLEGRVATDGAIAGRIQDDWDPSEEYAADYTNVFGQAFAAEALDAAGSDDTDAVTDFLLEQQCSDGYFRQSFADASDADQTCDGGDGKPNVDVTAAVVQALQSQLDDTDVKAAVDSAVAWLADQQKANGGFGSDADIPTANANSTGAAAYALLISGENDAAAKAAAWLRAHQATNVANCVYYDAADLGAVVYDNPARTSAQGGPMGASLHDQSVRATAQALPGLLAAQTGPGSPNVLSAPGYVKAGGKTSVGVNEATPGETLCAMLGEQSVIGWADPSGDATLALRLPKKAGTNTVDVANAGGKIGDADLTSLGAKKLSVSLKQKVKAGKKQKIKVTGLAAGESVSVTVTWPGTKNGGSGSGSGGQANAKGVFKTTLKAPKKVNGKAKVKVTGEFGNRKAKTTFTVVR